MRDLKSCIKDVIDVLESKNGDDIISLNLKDKGSLADVFILVTGNSDTHMRTLVEAAEEVLENDGRTCKTEGEQSSNWRLIDAGDLIVHVFSHKGRDFYHLERLWENLVE